MAKPNIYAGLIPFYKTSHALATYPERWQCDNGHIDWRENEIFEDVLEFEHFSRGRSAAHAIFTRSTGAELTVFLTDVADMIPHFVNGKVKGKFTFCKRGANYGCKMVE